MGFSLKKITRKILGKTGSKILGTAIDAVTGGTGSKLLLNGDSYINDAIKSVTGLDGAQLGLNVLGTILGGGTAQNVSSGGGLLSNLLLSGINWGNSVFSAKQAKEMAKWNSQLNYQYQTELNKQGFAHDQEMLKMQQEYDTQMANTAVNAEKQTLNQPTSIQFTQQTLTPEAEGLVVVVVYPEEVLKLQKPIGLD